MTVQIEILNKLFLEFSDFIKYSSDEEFQTFAGSSYLVNNENYKYKVYEEARESLGSTRWKPEDIGTGKIQKAVNASIKTRVNHNYQMVDNNLIDWRKKDDFSKRATDRRLEETIFGFYKSKNKENEAFELFSNEGLNYQFIAYLFFIKDCNRFLPISQERFDKIFEKIEVFDFKTRNNSSWENYSEYCSIIRQVRDFLRTKDKKATLLDAHSFLWILGNQMQQYQITSSTLPINLIENEKKGEIQTLEKPEEHVFPDELPAETLEELFEGIKRTVTVNLYERNPKARKQCIEHWKAICVACDFDFEYFYGEIGKGFIHVHHLTPLSQIGQSYQIDPIKDLVPVCPNCHAMIHRYEPPLSIEQLKSSIKKPTNTNFD